MFSAIYVLAAAVLIGVVGGLVNRKFGHPRTPAAYMKSAERATRRALASGTLKIPPGREGIRLDGTDLVVLGVLGTSLVPVSSIERVDVTGQDIYMVSGNRIVVSLPRRAISGESTLRTFLDRLGRPVLTFPG